MDADALSADSWHLCREIRTAKNRVDKFPVNIVAIVTPVELKTDPRERTKAECKLSISIIDRTFTRARNAFASSHRQQPVLCWLKRLPIVPEA